MKLSPKTNVAVKLGVIAAFAAVAWMLADDIDETSTGTPTVVTKSIVRQVTIDYDDTGAISTITARVQKTRDFGGGVVYSTEGMRSFPRSAFTNDWLSVVNQFEKTGAGRLRTFLFTGTFIGP